MYAYFMPSFEPAESTNVNQTSLAVHEAGEGAPVVFVHGGVSDLRTWANQVGPFAETFRAITYSRRYHCPNATIPSDAPDPIQTHVDDLAALIKARDADPAHIVGHSWGALIALLLAVDRPTLVRSLVLIEPPTVSMHVNVPPKFSQMIGLLFRSPKLAVAIAKLGIGALAPAEKAFRNGNDKKAVELFGRGVLGNRRFVSLSAERYKQVWDNRGPDRAIAIYDGFPDLRAIELAQVSMPVLLVSGSESPRVFPLLIDDLSQRLSNARRLVVQGASHIIHEDAPTALNDAVLHFLKEID
ncbi:MULTISPECIES: alpha/beta fold hydrolase [Roseobacteraceae]|uniref:Proline iminopeptidase n=1 Tax=Pseudosulfitobacter pseudonitzschiae TaxID=1402135 RepID=A0A221JZY1_9RHOB|nr:MULTISPECIES: alpha/beta hydrolase [Roseobacteraceae]ASM72180.1 proline iminopeptidase [Pseudosulfitobacter pseudonitzschiae]